MNYCMIGLALWLACFLWFVWAAEHAPMGYETEEEFFLGEPPTISRDPAKD